MKVARNIVFDCLRGEQTASEEDFSEIIAELENRIRPATLDLDDFELLPSDREEIMNVVQVLKKGRN